jgi:hypothetical protein
MPKLIRRSKSHRRSKPKSHRRSKPKSHRRSKPKSHRRSKPKSHRRSKPKSHRRSRSSSRSRRMRQKVCTDQEYDTMKEYLAYHDPAGKLKDDKRYTKGVFRVRYDNGDKGIAEMRACKTAERKTYKDFADVSNKPQTPFTDLRKSKLRPAPEEGFNEGKGKGFFKPVKGLNENDSKYKVQFESDESSDISH